jgi:hypothetical protein
MMQINHGRPGEAGDIVLSFLAVAQTENQERSNDRWRLVLYPQIQ